MRNQDPFAATPEQETSRNGASSDERDLSKPPTEESGDRRRSRERNRRKGGPTAKSVREDYAEVLNFCQFPSERRLSILKDMRAAGFRNGLDRNILRSIEEALRFEQVLHDHEAVWAGRSERAFNEGSRESAAQLERCLSSIFRILESIGESLPESQPQRQAADRLRKALFPNGVGAIASQAYKVEQALVGELIKRAAREESVRDLELLGLRPQIGHLTELHGAFGEVLRLSEPLEFAELQRLRGEGQQALCVLIVRVLGVHYGADSESRELREEMLRPVLFHDDQLRRGYRRRRATRPTEVENPEEAGPAPEE